MPVASRTAESADDRPDVFISYAREDKEFVDGLLTPALVAHGKDVWLDVEDIRGGASDWRASVWAGIESAKVVAFVLTPDSLASKVCGEELQRADELNKRIIPVLRRSVDGLEVPPALARPNWILARTEDDFATSATSLIDALELDEDWVEQHARLTQRTGEWLRRDRDTSYLLRGSDLRNAENWLDEQGAHREAPTAEQITYITASRRAAARRQRGLLGGVGTALVITAVLALARAPGMADGGRSRDDGTRAGPGGAVDRRAVTGSRGEPARRAGGGRIRRDLPEAAFSLRRAVSVAGWTRLLRLPERGRACRTSSSRTTGSRVATGGADGSRCGLGHRIGRVVTAVPASGAVRTVQFSPDGPEAADRLGGGRRADLGQLERRPAAGVRHEAMTWGRDLGRRGTAHPHCRPAWW